MHCSESEQKDRRQPQEDEEAAAVGHGRDHYTGAHRRVTPHLRQRHRDQHPHQRREQQVEGHRRRHNHTQRPTAIEQVSDHTDHSAPDQTVDQRHHQFLAHQARGIAGADLVKRHRAHDHGDRLVTGVTADTRHDRHQRCQRHQFLDRAFEQADHPRSDKRGDQVDCQPRPTVTQGFPDRGEDVFFFAQTGHVEDFAFALLTNQVDHFVDGQTADQLAVLVDHRGRDQVVTFERLSSVIGVFVRVKTHRIAGHDFSNLFFRIVDQQTLDRQHALEHAVVIDHEQFVGVARQLFETTQVTQNHFEADVLTDGHHLEVHQRTDLLLVIGQGRAHTLALLLIERLHQLMDDVSRQLGGQVSKFVGIHVLGSSQELVIVHVGDQCFPNGIGYFEKNVAVAISLDQLPERQTVVQRQGFKNVSNVSGVQIIEFALQLDEILPVNQVFDPVVMRAFLAMSQVFDDLLALQQLNDLSQTILQAFLCFLYFDFGHRRTPLPAAGHAGRINQSIHDW
ncbi:hypothetical protein EMIT0215P_170069 [Pseudomonas serboccidentalis]